MPVDEVPEPNHRAEQQRARRLANRSCGHCGEPAQEMKPWGRQRVPICGSCQLKLEKLAAPVPFCAFDEVHPRELRPQTSLEAVMVEARLLPAPDTFVEEQKPSLIGRMVHGVGRLFRRTQGRRALPAIPGESD